MRVKIEKLVYGGEGLARAGGATIFAPFVLPGEEAEIEVVERKKKLVRGNVTSLLAPSPRRIRARCPHFGICGGCNYQHISYDDQLIAKEEILRETLRRIGRIEWTQPITIHRSPPWEYRNRAQWKVRAAATQQARQTGTSSEQAASALGYFRVRSSALCAVEACPIISQALFDTFTKLRDALAQGRLPSTLREIEAFADAEDGKLLLNLSCSAIFRDGEALLETVAEIVPAAQSILVQDEAGRMALKGPGFLHYTAMHKQFRVGHLSFFQVNRFLVEEMAATVAALAGSGALAFDLYAGAGLFSVMLGETFANVVAVEADPAAARDLQTNTSHSKQFAIYNRTAREFLDEWRRKRNAGAPEVVIVDPPRAGLEEGVVEQFATLKPQAIIYVSCDPATLARDLAKLHPQAYTLREIHLFDMFPQTYHIESVVRLERIP